MVKVYCKLLNRTGEVIQKYCKFLLHGTCTHPDNLVSIDALGNRVYRLEPLQKNKNLDCPDYKKIPKNNDWHDN